MNTSMKEIVGELDLIKCFDTTRRLAGNIPNLTDLLMGRIKHTKADSAMLQRKLLTDTKVTTAIANLNRIHMFVGEPSEVESLADMGELLYLMDENINIIKLAIESLLTSDALKEIQGRRRESTEDNATITIGPYIREGLSHVTRYIVSYEKGLTPIVR